jgi:hypothetical protein
MKDYRQLHAAQLTMTEVDTTQPGDRDANIN